MKWAKALTQQGDPGRLRAWTGAGGQYAQQTGAIEHSVVQGVPGAQQKEIKLGSEGYA